MSFRVLILLTLGAVFAGVMVGKAVVANGQTPPTLPAPTGVTGTVLSPENGVIVVSVKWNPVSGAASYEIERSDRQFGEPATAYKYLETIGSETAYSERYVGGAPVGRETECFRIRAVTDRLVGAYAEKCVPLAIIDGPGGLPSPEVSDMELRAVYDPTPGSSARIEVSWASTAPAGADYQVERSVVNGIPLAPDAYVNIGGGIDLPRSSDGRFIFTEATPVTGRLICYRVRAVEGGVPTGYGPAACAQGAIGLALGTPGVVGTIALDKQIYVVGRDAAMVMTGQIPAFCGGTSAQVALYLRGGGALVNTRDDSVAPVVTSVGADGSFHASLPVPPKVNSADYRLWVGVAGSCLTAPIVGGGALLGVLDPVENKDIAGTFVIPAAVLGSTGSLLSGPTLGQSFGALSVFADGVLCTTVSLTSGPALDSSENVRIHVGGASQPAACSREGATISFAMPGGPALLETRTLLIGVTQTFSNFAHPPTDFGTGVVPGAPIAGNSRPGRDPGTPFWLMFVALACLVASGGSGAVALLRARRSPHVRA